MRKLALLIAALTVLAVLPSFAEKAKLSQMVSQGWTTEADEDLAKAFTKETGIEIEWQVNPAAQHHDLLSDNKSYREI